MQRVGQGPDVRVAEPLAVWPLVQHLQGGNLVAVLLDVLPEGAGERVGLRPGELRPDHRVLGYRVDGLLVGAVDLDQPLPQFRVSGEGLGCRIQQLPFRRFGDGLFRSGHPVRWPARASTQRDVSVGGVQQFRNQFLERGSPCPGLNCLPVLGREPTVQAGEAAGQ